MEGQIKAVKGSGRSRKGSERQWKVKERQWKVNPACPAPCGIRGPALRCVLVCAHETLHKRQCFVHFSRLKMDLMPFHYRLTYNRVHRRSTSPLGGDRMFGGWNGYAGRKGNRTQNCQNTAGTRRKGDEIAVEGRGNAVEGRGNTVKLQWKVEEMQWKVKERQ